MIAAYRGTDRPTGKRLMQRVIAGIADDVPPVLEELTSLGRR